ncbi:MAG: carboxypeptidase regulatory-like domain-containing protein [Acidobacteriota bacterium]
MVQMRLLTHRYSKRFLSVLIAVLIPAIFNGNFLRAQGTGTLHGTVKDQSGGVVPGVEVTAKLQERATTRTVLTDEQGAYVVPLLAVGTYTVTVEAPGFRTFHRDAVTLTSNQNVRVDVVPQVGEMSQSVTVSGEAALVDSRSSMMGTLIDDRRVLELPMNGRNIIELATILPGANAVEAPQTFTGDRDGPIVSMSGSRGNQNSFLFDGTQFNALFRNTGMNYPPPDSLREVKVLTNSFSAEYGRNSGSIFNVVSKSGTNEIHGSLWEFTRNDKLNARNFFAGSEKPKLIQNQFGATLGGPIKKDKLFLFGSYEGLRIRPGALSASVFPLTAAERGGDLSATTTKPIKDPETGQPFPGKQIPAARIDPVALKLLDFVPLPNRPDGQLVTTAAEPKDNDNFLVRADLNLGGHTIDSRYNYNLAQDEGWRGDVPSYMPVSRQAKSQNFTVGETFAIRPNLLNRARIGYNRMLAVVENLNKMHLSDLGADFPIFGGEKIPPNVGVSGRFTLGAGSGQSQVQENESFQASDNVHWTSGKHSLKVGFELLRNRYAYDSKFLVNGGFTFNGSITGNPTADFLLGKAASLRIASPSLVQDSSQLHTYYFLQDDWRIHSRLTLNLGLRYESTPPWVNAGDRWGTFRPGQKSQVVPNAPVGMVFVGDPGIPRGLIEADRNNWAPRIGLAWDLFGTGRTSLRAGYGIFYDTINADVIEPSSQPFRYDFTFNVPHSLSEPLKGQIEIPLEVNLQDPLFVGIQTLNYPVPDLCTPYVQHLNLNVQHEIVKDMVIQVGYVGKLGHKLIIGMSHNPALYQPGATLANINSRRIYPGFGDNRGLTTQANSNYHALQVELNKRFSRGFSLQSAYTYSRSIDQFSRITSNSTPVSNPFDLGAERGLSDFHAKHIASFSWISDLPAFASQNALVKGVLGGWQLNGFINLRSGSPITVLTGRDNALSGTGNQRPNQVGDPGLPENRTRDEKILAWFSRDAFAFPSEGTFGNAGRNTIVGPAYATTNLGLFKNFPLPGREGLKLQFRSEFFNAFNSVNLGNPRNQLSDSRMGRITGASSARVIQLALKVLF